MILTRTKRPSWRDLTRRTDDNLGECDIAAVNLACAEGLPGADAIDVVGCLQRLDEWSDAVRSYTHLVLPQFHRRPHEYENSEAYFRALCLITVLQRDLGVRYNPAKIPADAPFDTADSFIHGVLQGDGGTCATLPVVYAAVGRRLGYPIRLADARGEGMGHLFARWDDPRSGERFNIEASGRGMGTPDDNYYRTGRYAETTPVAEVAGGHIRSQTPRQELAGFLAARAWRWSDVKNWWQCVDSWAWATAMGETATCRNALKRAMNEWYREQEARKPLGFPEVRGRCTDRMFPPWFSLDLEKQIVGLTAVHHLLTDPRLETKYWRRMRQGDMIGTPKQALAEFTPDWRCQITLRFE